jgi:hypothetical protein
VELNTLVACMHHHHLGLKPKTGVIIKVLKEWTHDDECIYEILWEDNKIDIRYCWELKTLVAYE